MYYSPMYNIKTKALLPYVVLRLLYFISCLTGVPALKNIMWSRLWTHLYDISRPDYFRGPLRFRQDKYCMLLLDSPKSFVLIFGYLSRPHETFYHMNTFRCRNGGQRAIRFSVARQ